MMAIAPSDTLASRSSMARHVGDQSSAGLENNNRDVKLSQILPNGPSRRHLKLETNRSLGYKTSRHLSFRESFGVLGIPMIIILVVCLAWTTWLIILALAPNETANTLMNTGAYDNGKFWYITDANPSMTLAGAIGLMVVDVGYLLVLLRAVLWRNLLVSSSTRSKAGTWASSRILQVIGPSYKRGRQLWKELTSYEGRNRKRWNAFLKLIDLVMETAVLRQLLQSGSPVSLTYGFAGFLAVNALSCVVNVLTDRFSALTEIVVDSMYDVGHLLTVTKFSFDLAAAVLFPILMLLYCYYNFDFDRQAYLFYLEILPAGSFEHNARSLADPSEMALFRVIFDSLRINSPLDFAIRISMNLALCYRFERVLESLIWSRYREYASRGVKKTVPNTTTPVPQNAVPKGVVSVYVAAILAILLSTHKAITDSETLCSSYPECVVYAHRWQTSDEHCPCVILIDVDLAPKMYNQWVDPVNAYDTVKTLAGAGMLTSLQVINRQLVAWPEELRRCSGLKTIQLIYTDVEHIPAWAKDFHRLVTIQIEGRYGSTNLVALPDDLFSDLPRLSMIHLGIHVNLQAIPAFTGVPNLQSLTLAWTNQLRQLPSFEHVPKLSRLVLTLLPRLERIPDLSPLEKLVEFVVFRPNRVCCNGFMGPCNLTHGSCQANSLFGTSPATCLMNDQNPKLSVAPFLGSSATAKAFETFSPFICQENLFDKLELSLFPTKETITMCQGKSYRQCQFPGNITGICYNTRFQVLSCVPDDNYIALRRLEIAKGIGPVCDPAVEKWLGCTK
ncbi:hypothetical protein PC116_g13708 [Phytophthora cactorum]|nr:hypothetical protein PC112_g16374 [Phytophthora cactorum]KAG2857537.1 hypothetical protein PC113_g10600 [Phytophthora cactorum]KAG3085130.1 hypothetical protein PC122_g9825 [Phytophthora cactorum]KAG4238245.1 hypothetical protein PC116_g13708 [Phytophthora cactorum]RAW35118.1 hypothetical protein PC110_g8583 [Phytophthora cactorum]